MTLWTPTAVGAAVGNQAGLRIWPDGFHVLDGAAPEVTVPRAAHAGVRRAES
ncbi:hypothetical protein [Streptomyces sp. OE57]|uniref:hypothetical protein n=1 Tax=Streptomyces lacaronensis TaxID=3379885 RepID=UPI0039B76738